MNDDSRRMQPYNPGRAGLSLIQSGVDDVRELIAGMLERYKVAFFSKDVEALVELYDRDARIFDACTQGSYEGLGAWRRCVNAWFDSLPDERLLVVSEGMEIAASGELGAAQGFMMYTAMSRSGMERRSMKNRFTWIVERRFGVWKVVHEHTSLAGSS